MKRIYTRDIEEIRLKDKTGSSYKAFYDDATGELRIELDNPPPPPPPQKIMDKFKGGGDGKSRKQDEKKFKKKHKGGEKQTPPPRLEDSTFRSRLSSIMRDNKFDRKTRGQLRGRIDLTRLPRVATGSKNVFTQKVSRKNKEYNIILLVDNSGSMEEKDMHDKTRYEHAAESAIFLAKSFIGLNINLQIVMFNHYIWTVKGFDEKLDVDKVYGELNRIHSGMGCNHDLQAMRETYKMFKGRKGKNILVLLSDGLPTACKNSFSYYPEKRQQALEPIENMKDENGDVHFHKLIHSNRALADTIALGMQSTVKQVPDSIRVDDMGEMKSALLKLLNKKIRRG